MDIKRQMENVIVDTMDWISQLPECIIHHILSYLDSLKDLVRMSILSTYWFGVTASFPILIFNFFTFKEVIKSSGIPFGTDEDIRDTFFKYVEYTISRFRDQNVNVHTFKLNTPVSNSTEVYIINRCLEKLTIKKGVKVLVIDIVSYWGRVPNPRQRFRVPNILLTATSLTSLTLSYCVLPLSLMVDHVFKFKCLKLLCLKGIKLNEDVIKSLTSCPLLEELIVKHCYGLQRFCVYGLLNLQQVEFCFGPEVERIEIDAPNLCFLCLNECDKTKKPPSMNLASCKKLTKVCYHGKRLADLSSDFPVLEDLFLVLPDECKRLNVSSHSKCELVKINVNASNLQLFGCRDDLHFYSPKETILVPSKACIEWDITTDKFFIQGYWFQNLRQFLDNKIWFKELKLHIYVGAIVSIEPEAMIQWPPIEFDHVELEAEEFEYKGMYELVVDSLLWCCRPQSLTLIIDFSLLEFKEWEIVVKYTYKMLLEQEDQVHTNILFVMSSSSSRAHMNFGDLSTLLKALPRDKSKQKITFIKYRSCSRSRKRKPSKVSESIHQRRWRSI